jgi:hypothetical protein
VFPIEPVWTRLAREEDEESRWFDWLLTARTANVPPGKFSPWRLQKLQALSSLSEQGRKAKQVEAAQAMELEEEGRKEGDEGEEGEGGGFDVREEAAEQALAARQQQQEEQQRANSQPVKLYNKVVKVHKCSPWYPYRYW